MYYDLSLKEDDFLTYSLYKASKSKIAKQQMNGSWVWLSVGFFLFSIASYLDDSITFSIFFGILGVITMIFYPVYQKKHYISHYKKHIKDHYSSEIAIRKIGLLIDHLKFENAYSQSNLDFAGITYVSEISTHIFINLKGGNGIIVPKHTVDFDILKKELQKICSEHGLNYITELNWKW